MKLQCRKFFMKEIAKHSKMHCNMFFHSILYPFLPYYSGNTLDSLSVICAALTCTFSTMTKSTFCNATTNYGDSEALQKCLILSARINHFANQSNYSQNDVSFGTEVCKLLVKKVKNVTRKEAAVKLKKFEGVFL